MKQVIILVLVTISLYAYGQKSNDYTLDFFVSSVDEMTFDLTLKKSDSVILSRGFNFEKFTPSDFAYTNGFYKTQYVNKKIILIEYYTDSNYSKLEYKCYVNDFDSLKYFVFVKPINVDTFVSSHSIGVNIATKDLSLIIATHRFSNNDTIIKNDSSFAINYPGPEQFQKESKYSFSNNYKINWIDNAYYSGRSVLIIDSNLLPLHRFYFDYDFLIYFTNSEVINDTCAEYFFSYNPRINQSLKGKYFINTIDIELLLRIKQINSMWPTFIIKHSFSLEDYYFSWEYYKFFIGRQW